MKSSIPSVGASTRELWFAIAVTLLMILAAEGVAGDLAFAQSIIETGYFNFSARVLPSYNNFSGLGAVDGGTGAATFATAYSEDAYVIAASDRRTDGVILDALISE